MRDRDGVIRRFDGRERPRAGQHSRRKNRANELAKVSRRSREHLAPVTLPVLRARELVDNFY